MRVKCKKYYSRLVKVGDEFNVKSVSQDKYLIQCPNGGVYYVRKEFFDEIDDNIDLFPTY